MLLSTMQRLWILLFIPTIYSIYKKLRVAVKRMLSWSGTGRGVSKWEVEIKWCEIRSSHELRDNGTIPSPRSYSGYNDP